MEQQLPPAPGRSATHGQAKGAPDAEAGAWDYVEVVLRRWWIVALGVALVGAGGWELARRHGDRYTAQVLLQIRLARDALGVVDLVATPFERPEAVTSELEVLRSYAVLSRAVGSVGLRLVLNRAGGRSNLLDSVEVLPEAPPGSYMLSSANGRFVLARGVSDSPLATARSGEWLEARGLRLHLAAAARIEKPLSLTVVSAAQATVRLVQDLNVRQTRGTMFVRLRYTNPDPVLAAAVLNAVAKAYSDYSIERAREESRRRRDFIAGQLRDLADSMAATQAALQTYQERAGTLDPAIDARNLTLALLDGRSQLRQLRFRESVLGELLAALRSQELEAEGLPRLAAISKEMMPAAETMYERLQELLAERQRLTASRVGHTAQNPNVETLDSLIASAKGEVRAVAEQSLQIVQASRHAAEATVADLAAQVDRLPQQAAALSRLTQRVEAVQKIFDALLQQYYHEQIAEATTQGSGEVVDMALVPAVPDPDQRRILVLSLLLGLVLGTGGAFLVDTLDASVRFVADTERAAGLQVIAQIPKLAPRLEGKGSNGRPMLVLYSDARGREAFRVLRTTLRFVRAERPRVLAVTSAGPREGKTTVAVNLAAALAQEGSKVLLVDGDLRRPSIHRVFDIERAPGLSDVLVGEVSPEKVVRASGVEGLSVTACGTRVNSHAEILGSQALRQFLGYAKDRFEYVVVDTAPVLAVTDPVLVGHETDGVMVVALADHTSRFALEHAVRQLRGGGAFLVGTVLNKVAPGAFYRRYRDGAYRYYYANRSDPDAETAAPGRGLKAWVSRLRH